MANAETTAPVRAEWVLGNPWAWMTTGLAASGLASVLARLDADAVPVLRGLLIFIGLVGTLAALNLRFHAGIERPVVNLAPAARAGVALLAALFAATISVLMVLMWRRATSFPWELSHVFIFWLMTAPGATVVAVGLWPRHAEVSPRVEGAALVFLAGLVAFLTCWALYLGPDRAGEWDSMRVFFAGVALAAFVASPLVGAPQALRRFLVSVLVVLHLGGILTAVMATPPGPWVFSVIWARVYQPYLEFMWLNNAYRFYSPEPNAATQAWFRIEYVKGEPVIRTFPVPFTPLAFHIEDRSKMVLLHRWVKLPDLKDDRDPNYPLRLQYQRRLALTENLKGTEPVPPDRFQVILNRRAAQAPQPAAQQGVLGVRPEFVLGLPVPYHPGFTPADQFRHPDASTRMLLSSYARHVLQDQHPTDPEAKPARVKIYRVVHRFLDAKQMGEDEDPLDPRLYLPWFVGEYDTDGNLVDPNDPFLYWLLPMMPDANEPGVVNAYAYLHAGDEDSWRIEVPRRDDRRR
jgi:hypothetical protein